MSKEIVVSYAPSDRESACRLSQVLKDWFDQDTWLRDFDLDGGQLIADALGQAIGEAKWFILLLSANAAKSEWVTREASLATFQAIRGEAFAILTLNLDSTSVPDHLRTAFTAAKEFSIGSGEDIEDAALRIAAHIDEASQARPDAEIYVDRGSDADRFALAARRTRVILLVGPAGIGKTAFCRRSVAEKLQKRPLWVRVTRGHSADLLSRQVLEVCHVPQPISPILPDDELMDLAVDALVKRSAKFYLVLDNAEEGIDADNILLPYLEQFLYKVILRAVETHVIVVTARHPNLPPYIETVADLLQLTRLHDDFVLECIDLWMEQSPNHEEVLQSPYLREVVRLAAGFPFAARMIASQLKANITPSLLLTSGQRKRFELKLAAHILRTLSKDLADLDELILHTLATVHEPMAVEDLLSVREISAHSLDAIHDSIWKLSELFLLQQSGELLSLHRFLETYFSEQVTQHGDRRHRIAYDFGHFSYRKALELNTRLNQVLSREGNHQDEESVARLSGMILKYAVPAAHLLRSVGDIELAEQLPIQVRGTLRQMVFFFYQEARDYRAALSYAEQWLQLSPGDVEVQLYQARCHRNLRSPSDLNRAKEILASIESRSSSAYYRARILREKAVIAEASRDIPEARKNFEEGVALQMGGYIDNHVGLAQLLLRESEHNAEGAATQREVERAIALLDVAREANAIFDRLHLGLYVEALLRGGRTEQAEPLLLEALEDRPEDPRLNYHFAEMLRKGGNYPAAEKYAKIALRCGAPKAQLTLANIYCSQAIQAQAVGDVGWSRELLTMARTELDSFRPEFGHDAEVADGIRAKSYRIEGEWGDAEQVLSKYPDSRNPYTVYEHSNVDLQRALREYSDGDPAAGRQLRERVLDRIDRLEKLQGLPDALRELRSEVRQLILGSE